MRLHPVAAVAFGALGLLVAVARSDAQAPGCTSFASCCPAFKDYVGKDCLVQVWPKGRIPYAYDTTIRAEERPKIRAAFDRWQTMTGGRIAFVESATDPLRVLVKGDGAGRCSSGLPGRQASGVRPVRWHAGCPYGHEAGHVIGLYHEHQRFDRDRYFAIDPPQISCDSYYDVVKRCAMTTDTSYGEYNPRSVMHYRFARPPCHVKLRNGECVPSLKFDDITPHDASNVLELYAHKEYGWAPFRSIGRDNGPGAPLGPEIADKVTVSGDPALTAQRDGSNNLFVRGSDGQLWHRFRVGEAWSAWYPMGGALASSPGAASFGRGSVIVAAQLSNGRLGLRQHTAGGWGAWTEIAPPPGGAASAPALAVIGPGRLAVLVRGTDNRLWRLAHDLGRPVAAADWVDEGGQLVNNPAAAASANGQVDVVVATAARSLWHWNSASRAWKQIGCCVDPASSPAIASREAGLFDLVIRDTDGRLRHQAWSKGAMSDWRQLGGILASSPAIAATGARRLDVVAIGTDAALKHRSWDR